MSPYLSRLQGQVSFQGIVKLLEGIKNKKRLGFGEEAIYQNPKVYIRQSAKELIAKEGISGMYRGIGPALIRAKKSDSSYGVIGPLNRRLPLGVLETAITSTLQCFLKDTRLLLPTPF